VQTTATYCGHHVSGYTAAQCIVIGPVWVCDSRWMGGRVVSEPCLRLSDCWFYLEFM